MHFSDWKTNQSVEKYLVGAEVSKSSDSIAPIFDCFDFWNWKCIFCEERSSKFRDQVEFRGAWNPGFQQICIFRKINLFGIALRGSSKFLQSHKAKPSSSQTQFGVTQIFGTQPVIISWDTATNINAFDLFASSLKCCLNWCSPKLICWSRR